MRWCPAFVGDSDKKVGRCLKGPFGIFALTKQIKVDAYNYESLMRSIKHMPLIP